MLLAVYTGTPAAEMLAAVSVIDRGDAPQVGNDNLTSAPVTVAVPVVTVTVPPIALLNEASDAVPPVPAAFWTVHVAGETTESPASRSYFLFVSV